MTPSRGKVYPRAYGGTPWKKHFEGDRANLSPRVRGNLTRFHLYLCHLESIPARTGEPPYRPGRPGRYPVYPRAYGGTLARRVRQLPVDGLSPRVRGNPPKVDKIRIRQ